MSSDSTIPELKQILGALIFAAHHPLTVTEMRKTLVEVAQTQGGHTASFGPVKDSDIRAALGQLNEDFSRLCPGFTVVEVADGYKLQSDDKCGHWVRHLLNADKPRRLSRPALETLAIIAYRQPVTRAEIEAIRGVNIDHIIASLMELELVRIVGRSDLPGRPMLFGTSKTFLEHFGLQSTEALPGMEQLARIDRDRVKQEPAETGGNDAQPADAGEPAGPADTADLAEAPDTTGSTDTAKPEPAAEDEVDDTADDEDEDEEDEEDEDDTEGEEDGEEV